MKRSTSFALIALAAAGLLGAVASNFGSAKGSANFRAGRTEARNHTASSSSRTASENALFRSRRVLLVCSDEHPLTTRIGELVRDRLKELPDIEQVDVARPDAILAGERAPDLFLRIGLDRIEHDGIVSRSLKAVVTSSLGDAPWRGNHYVRRDSTPPLVQLDFHSTVEHESTFTGVRTDRYAEAAASIANELTKALSNEVSKVAGLYPQGPALPDDLHGPYEAVADFAFLKELNARRTASYFGLMTHNETFWRFQISTHNTVDPLIRRIEQAGWKLQDTTTNADFFHASFDREGAELEIFRQRTDSRDVSSPRKEPAAVDFIAHYRKPFSRAKREALFDRMFEEGRSIESLLPFLDSFSPAQRERFYASLENTAVRSPQICVQLAQKYLSRHETNSAARMLQRAQVLAGAATDPSAIQKRIDDLAKKILPGQQWTRDFSAEACRDLGLPELTGRPQILELEAEPGQAVIWFAQGRSTTIFNLTIHPPKKGAYPWRMVMNESFGRSIMNSTFTPSKAGDWQHSFTHDSTTFKVIARPEAQRIKYTIQSVP